MESIYGNPEPNKKEAPQISEQSTNFPIAKHIYFGRVLNFTEHIQKRTFWQRLDLLSQVNFHSSTYFGKIFFLLHSELIN